MESLSFNPMLDTQGILKSTASFGTLCMMMKWMDVYSVQQRKKKKSAVGWC